MAQEKALIEASTLDGTILSRAFNAGTRCIERYRDVINALNVYPVPDGDTGTNMLLTLRSAEEELRRVPSSTAGEVMAALAHGALLGARGNSGVILSQFLAGMAGALNGKQCLTAEDVADSLRQASQEAYTALSQPVEGTMLTVMRKLSEAAQEAVSNGARDPLAVLQASTQAARVAVANTPFQLPVLREAGVVDAGGQGIALLLEGMVCFLAGGCVEEESFEICAPPDGGLSTAPAVHEDYLAAAETEEYGHCIQFLLQGEGLDIDALRRNLAVIADSTVVVGDHSLARIHVHAIDPEPALNLARSLGTLSRLSIDNIDQQRQEFVAHHRRRRKKEKVAVVAVAQGEGLEAILNNLHCASVASGGQSANPSNQELLEAVRHANGADVILLPNNPNVILAARQAAKEYGSRLHVVPSRSIPQGIAALLAFNQEWAVEPNLQAMEKAMGEVKSIEVTRAVRSSSLAQLRVAKGDYIALVEGEMVAVGETPLSALEQALCHCHVAAGNLVTLYWGADLADEDIREAEASLARRFPGLEVEVHWGGQPLYQYLASVD